jgi:hypothetical protein
MQPSYTKEISWRLQAKLNQIKTREDQFHQHFLYEISFEIKIRLETIFLLYETYSQCSFISSAVFHTWNRVNYLYNLFF